MKSEVAKAAAELSARYPGLVEVGDLGNGGAKVEVKSLSLRGGPFIQEETWCGFTITAIHPYGDIYPHFVRPDLSRRDQRPFGQGFHPNNNFYGKSALMLSRRCKLVTAEYPTNPIQKLEKVLQWLTSQ